MRITIHKNLKKPLSAIIAILICATSFLLYKEVMDPGFKEEAVSLYKYNNNVNVNYRVFLKPNILYSGESVEKGNMYVTEFIKYINTFMEYEFSGERTAEINGDYEVIAVVEGYTGEEKTYKSIWKKEFRLLEKTPFYSNDNTVSIKKEIPLKFNDYNKFAQRVIEDSKVSCEVKMTVFWNVNMKAKTDMGLIEEQIVSTMIIPLNNSYFEIMGQLFEEKSGSIEDTKQIQLPVDKKIVITYSVIMSILLIILGFLIFFTKPAMDMNPLEKKLKKIFKNHGDRLVALNNDIGVTCEDYNRVKSINDLVKIADEIAKPIMYKHSADFNHMTEFYVFDDTQIYMLDLKDILLETNKEKRKDENDRYIFGKNLFKLKNKMAKREEAETEKEI